MTIRFWFRKVFARPATHPLRKAPVRCKRLPRRIVLELQALEDRLVPAISSPT